MKIFRELLFLQGYSNRPQDLADVRDCSQSQGAVGGQRERRSSLRMLWLLGGRPMHAGHNYDREEPFEGYAVRARPDPRACCS